MTDGHGQTEAISDLLLQLLLPDPTASAIRPTAIGFNEQMSGPRKALGQFGLTPAPDVIDSKPWRIARLPHKHRATIMLLVVEAIGNGATLALTEEIMDVATSDGDVPISELEVGDKVLAYDEDTDNTGEYKISAIHVNEDSIIVHVEIDGELVETTPEHPFYTEENSWVAAGDLQVGDHIRKVDGTYGVVEFTETLEQSETMYNLTVENAHTFFVGEGQWLVHNICKYDMFLI